MVFEDFNDEDEVRKSVADLLDWTEHAQVKVCVCPLQVIEPNLGDGGETIAILAIKVSVTSVFSR